MDVWENEKQRIKEKRREERKAEFAAGFFAGLAVIGGLALILLALFWFL